MMLAGNGQVATVVGKFGRQAGIFVGLEYPQPRVFISVFSYSHKTAEILGRIRHCPSVISCSLIILVNYTHLIGPAGPAACDLSHKIQELSQKFGLLVRPAVSGRPYFKGPELYPIASV
jgi:hypothetical protein